MFLSVTARWSIRTSPFRNQRLWSSRDFVSCTFRNVILETVYRRSLCKQLKRVFFISKSCKFFLSLMCRYKISSMILRLLVQMSTAHKFRYKTNFSWLLTSKHRQISSLESLPIYLSSSFKQALLLMLFLLKSVPETNYPVLRNKY